MSPDRVEKIDTLIIGAGLIGSSVAMHLAQKGVSNIRVIDFDLEGSLSSSELNAGGVRATWTQDINIEVSKSSIEYFEKVREDVGYLDCGYLWLCSEDRVSEVEKSRDRQVALGWEVQQWGVSELQKQVPFIDKTQGIGCAFFAPKDGLVNPNLLKMHYREQARNLGVRFDDRVFVTGFEYLEKSESGGVDCHAQKYPQDLDVEVRKTVLTGGSPGDGVSPTAVRYRAQRVINCAGPWAPEISRLLGYTCPSQPIRRQISIFDCRDVDLSEYGMIVDTSGVYFHPEAMNGLAGFAIANEPPGLNFDYDGEDFFMERIWAPLYERSTQFERLKHLTGWSGLYEVSPDHSAIVGRVNQGEAGRYGQIYEAHSFSGHGAMQSYSAGLGLAEQIVEGRYETIDLSPLSGDRVVDERWIVEGSMI